MVTDGTDRTVRSAGDRGRAGGHRRRRAPRARGRLGRDHRRARARASAAAPTPSRAAARVLDADGCLVTPGLDQHPPPHLPEPHPQPTARRVNGTLFQWLTTLYPLWAALDEEAAYVSAWVGLAELALGGCTTSDRPPLRAPTRRRRPDHRRDPRRAASSGMRFHPTRGSMSLSQKDGGLPPDSVVQDDDEILADSERLVGAAPRPRVGRDGAHRAGAVLAVLGDARADAGDRRAGRAARRAPAHPPGRGPRRGHATAEEAFGCRTDRALRGRRAGAATGRGSRTASTRTTTRSRGSARGAPAWRTARART